MRVWWACLFCLCLVGCDRMPWEEEETAPEPEEHAHGVLRIALDSQLSSLDPRRGDSRASQTLSMMLFEGLTRLDREDRVQYALAKRVDVSEDGLTYIFDLRDSYWSDGSPLSAVDFEYAWTTALSPRYPSPRAESLFVLKNARLIKEGKLPASELGVSVLTDQRLIVKLEEPTPHFLELLASHPFFPVASMNDRDNPHWSLSAGEHFISNGPFKLVEWDQGRSLRLRKNPFYWDRYAVQLSEIELLLSHETAALRLFSEGSLDWVGQPFMHLSTHSLQLFRQQDSLQQDTGTAVLWCRLNISDLPQPRLRRALSLAIDRQALSRALPRRWHRRVDGLLPPQRGWRSPEALPLEDPRLAAALMRQVFPNGTAPIELSLSTEKEEFQPLAQLLKEQWETTLPVKIHFVEEGGQIHLGSHDSPCAAPMHLLKHLAAISDWQDPVFQQLIAMAQREPHPNKRRQILRLAEQLALEEAPVIPLLHERRYYLRRPHLQNGQLSSAGWLDLKHAYIQETLP